MNSASTSTGGIKNVNINGDNVNIASTSGAKIGFFGTAASARTGAGLTTLAQLYTALRALGLLASA